MVAIRETSVKDISPWITSIKFIVHTDKLNLLICIVSRLSWSKLHFCRSKPDHWDSKKYKEFCFDRVKPVLPPGCIQKKWCTEFARFEHVHHRFHMNKTYHTNTTPSFSLHLAATAFLRFIYVESMYILKWMDVMHVQIWLRNVLCYLKKTKLKWNTVMLFSAEWLEDVFTRDSSPFSSVSTRQKKS